MLPPGRPTGASTSSETGFRGTFHTHPRNWTGTVEHVRRANKLVVGCDQPVQARRTVCASFRHPRDPVSVDGSHRSRNSKTRRFSAGGGACGACGARAGLVYRLPVGSSKKAQQKSSRALRKRRDGAPSRSVGVDERVLEVGWLFEVRFLLPSKGRKKRTWRGGVVNNGRGEVEVQTRTLLG